MRTLYRFVSLLSLLLGAGALAGGPIPAVDLPWQAPESVRDATARALSLSRDTLGWVTHPYRGEFHGLGAPVSGSSRAYDLSANGRVVVGADDDNGSGASRGFVWSPWTGRANYNMLPNGVSGDTVATTISADGVYVAGNVATAGNDVAFRWSLAGRESIPPAPGGVRNAVAISGDGRVVVGTTRTPNASSSNYCNDESQDRLCVAPVSYLLIDIASQAYRYTRAGGVEELLLPENYRSSEAVNVSADGRVILGNMSRNRIYVPDHTSQPVLWRDGEALGLGVYSMFTSNDPGPITLNDVGPGVELNSTPILLTHATTANALSADGRTVVGVHTTRPFFEYVTITDVGVPPTYNPFWYEKQTALLWREETGWVDLGELRTTSFRSFSGAEATGVSGDGQLVIGSATVDLSCCPECDCYFPNGDTIDVPFIWDDAREMRELESVLRYDYGLDLSGWDLGEATAISDDGSTIIGAGTNPAGQTEAWRAMLERNTPHGDLDFDGDVDHHDYQTLVANLGATSDDRAVYYADGDLNADGLVDQSDADTLLGLYEHRVRGDFNADGVVDLADYTVWRDRLGELTDGIADSNGDGRVDHADLAVWRAHFGEILGSLLPHLVPEPAAATLLGAVLMTAAFRRRR